MRQGVSHFAPAIFIVNIISHCLAKPQSLQKLQMTQEVEVFMRQGAFPSALSKLILKLFEYSTAYAGQPDGAACAAIHAHRGTASHPWFLTMRRQRDESVHGLQAVRCRRRLRCWRAYRTWA